MAIFKSRLPARADLWFVFSSIIFVVNVWAIINILRAVPSWILSHTIWEMIGIISYPLVFALLESALFTLGLVVMAFLLPSKLLRDNFISQGSLAALIASLGIILAHLYGSDFGIWSVRSFAKYVLLLIIIILASWVLVYFFKRLNTIIVTVTKRISPLSTAYLALDLLSIFVIVIRNL
ncbi:MAG: hypothetical protein JSV42_13475 [Chloroflexota bacterium]|nr:MAG: hypothetical protein JSV42_13475 [Chloroflexota bacterium]